HGSLCSCVTFFTDTAPTAMYTLSLHDALPILEGVRYLALVHGDLDGGLAEAQRAGRSAVNRRAVALARRQARVAQGVERQAEPRSEEHTSELQSLAYLVCRLLLEKKN